MNWAEPWFLSMRQAESGQHHDISGNYLAAYAGEMAWREDSRRQPNGAFHEIAASAVPTCPVSRTKAGYRPMLK
jgi:hypothetical protein